jgi:protein gp37
MGCDNCYAAKLTATRLADVYPGLAVKKTVDGKTTYQFTGKIQLVPHDLADPLHDKISKRYFVNSMSDLFHKNVPDAYIEAVFDVMEKASWHTFQVLTKRPERMAEFTQKRYADKDPAANIWLGTSTENQAAYDDRMPHLKATKAAIRWLSVEPMLGPIKFGSMKDIDWVVVGGESGSDRQMKKEWATGIRDACKKDEVPFFFKQWGDFNEQGKKKAKKGGDAKLDGKIHHNYPKV